jgi:hypothetical protein
MTQTIEARSSTSTASEKIKRGCGIKTKLTDSHLKLAATDQIAHVYIDLMVSYTQAP